MVLLENKTGEIQALVGGREHTQQRSFNRATQAVRQPGSAIKPLVVYAPALEKGYTTALSLLDSPVTIGNNTFNNYDHKYAGWITMRTAVQWSKNTYAVRLLHNMGADYGLEFGKKLGITSFDDSRDSNLSLALGGITYGISPLEMAGAYGAIANQGVYIEPHSILRIIDSDGKVLYEANPQKRVAMSEQTAYIMTDLLQTVVKSGTGTRARMNRPVAGKTGTTEETKDIWFMGYTPEFTGAVWMGFDQEENIKDGQAAGGYHPALIWRAVMQKASEGLPVQQFTRPSGIVNKAICTKSGKLPNAFCPKEDLINEVFVQGSLPNETCDLHVQVEICEETKMLANEYCPHKIKAVFLKGAKSGEQLPEKVCEKHGPEDQKKVTVRVCTDPRHNGVLYLANESGLLETGGCPHEFIEERKFLPEEAPKMHCPLKEHQVTKKSLINNPDNGQGSE
jgi:penicillin-binding protein 1A